MTITAKALTLSDIFSLNAVWTLRVNGIRNGNTVTGEEAKKHFSGLELIDTHCGLKFNTEGMPCKEFSFNYKDNNLENGTVRPNFVKF